MAPKPPLNARPPQSTIPALRAAIEKAEADGLDKSALVLRLTLRDESVLKRDRSIGLHELHFDNGQMSFLGVPVVAGGVAQSSLDRGDA